MVSRIAISTQSLLAQGFGINAVGLCITGASAAIPAVQNLPPAFGWIAMFAAFALLFVINATRANEPLSLLLFYVFTFLEGVFLAPLIGYYLHTGGGSVVVNAALTTGLG